MRPPSARTFGCIAGIVTVLLVTILLGLPSTSLAQAAAPATAEYAGSEVCKNCHEDRFASYQAGVHGIKADPRRPAAKQECETCHGPGKAHADAGGGRGVGGIIGLTPRAPASPEVKNAQCLQCHAGSTGGLKHTRALWTGSIHESRGVTCATCHTVHGGRPAQPDACVECHKQIKAQLLKSSHHPIREGKVQCTDCHNPHGTVADKLIRANFVNEICYQCHAEKRGPFLWEHPPAIENCAACHTPHGSSHDKLLIMKRPTLCQTCHSNSRHPGTLYALTPAQRGQSVYQALSNRLFNRACSNCHSQIHGSNHPSGKALAR